LYNEFVVNILEGAIFGKKALEKPRLQYLKEVGRNIGADCYIAMNRSGLQQIQMESCQPIQRLRVKRRGYSKEWG